MNFFARQRQLLVNFCRATLLCLIASMSINAHAVVASGFFQSQQPVEDQSEKHRRYAVKKGFEEVLTKLAGSRQILLRPELRVALQNPNVYLQKFSYFVKDDDPEQSWVRLDFNGTQVESIFYDMQLPLWSKDRAPILVWFGVDDGPLGRDILSDANPRLSQFKDTLSAEANRRGLSLRWPQLDDQDLLTISMTDLWSMDMTAIANASRRYSAQLVLLGKASHSPSKRWYSQWGMEYEGRAQWFEGNGESFQEVSKKLIDSIAQELSSTFAIEVGHDMSESVLLEIQGAHRLKDFAEISALLEGLLPITHLAVVEATPETLVFELQVQGGVQQLRPSLKLQRRLRAMPRYVAPERAPAREPALESEPVLNAQAPLVEAASEEKTMIKYRWLGGQ